MIKISRRKGESIEIGADVQVVMLGVKGNRMSIGVVAPSETRIERLGRDAPPMKSEEGFASTPAASEDE